MDRIKEIRREVEPEFNSCFEDAKQIAEDLDIVVKTPKVCFKQQHRENISTYIRCVIPITTCEAERSFSGLRRIKSYMRSTMHENRLTGLALMHLHHSVEIDPKEIAELFIRQGKRRLFQSSFFYLNNTHYKKT